MAADAAGRPADGDLAAGFRRRWLAGDPVPAEEFARQAGRPVGGDELLDLIEEELVLREQRGEDPGLSEYQRRFPGLAEQVGVQFAVHQVLRDEPGTDTRSGGGPAATPSPGGRPPPDPLPAVPGYEVERELGRGGMGVVYLARQVSLNRPVALKMVLGGGAARPAAVAGSWPRGRSSPGCNTRTSSRCTRSAGTPGTRSRPSNTSPAAPWPTGWPAGGTRRTPPA